MNIVIVVATTIDPNAARDSDRTKVILTETYHEKVGRKMLELPTGIDPELVNHDDKNPIPLERLAEQVLLQQVAYEAKEMRYLGQGAILPSLQDDIVSFFLAVDIKRPKCTTCSNARYLLDTGAPGRPMGFKKCDCCDTGDIVVHEAPIIHIGPWTYKTGLMIAPTLWAGLYLRVAHLLSNPLDGEIQ